MYQDLLRDASFFELLHRMDLDLSEAARCCGCRCGGVLHSARYRRKPRGGPPGLAAACSVRESYCCAEEGCRRRSTPCSVRFLGRKVFFAVVLLLVPILRDGMTAARFRRLESELPVSRRTVLRWRRFWRDQFPTTWSWLALRGAVPDLPRASAPGSLLDAFSGVEVGRDRVIAVLCWLSDSTAEEHPR